jgi:hypothetical protein
MKKRFVVLKEVSEKEIEEITIQSDQAVKSFDKELKLILNKVIKLDTHCKLMCLNEIITKMLASCNLSQFVVNGMLEGIKQAFEYRQIQQPASIPEGYRSSYLG